MLKAISTTVAGIGLITLLSACNHDKDSAKNEIKLDNQTNKASYSIGLQFGSQINKIKDMVNEDAIIEGFKDSLVGNEPKLTAEEMQTTMQAFQKTMMDAQKVKQDELAKSGKAEGDKFLAENKAKEGVKTTESGLQYQVLTEGKGAKPKATDTVITHYTGTTIDGKVFDSSYKRNAPATFPVNGVIKGWTEALQLMNVGSKWKLYIPSELAYGERGAGANIGPNQVLIFEIELLEIKKS
jgi:FKBP-type peptidyl-prolyl cis-trans isomerase FklB